MDRRIVNELRQVIKDELGECNSELWPELCALRHSKEGYKKIEETVIRLVATDGMPIGSALAMIEQELAHAIDE